MHSAAPVDRVWTEDEQWWDPVTVISSIQKQSGTLHQEGICTATASSRLALWCHDAMLHVSQKRICIRFRYAVVPPLFGSETRATSASSTAVPSVRDEDGVVGMHDGHVDVLIEAPSSSITRSTHTTTTTTTTAAAHTTAAAAASVGRMELHHVAGIRGLPCFPLRPLHRRPMKPEKKRTAHRPVSANERADGSSSSSCFTQEGLVARPNSNKNDDTMGAGAASEQQSQLHMMDVCVGTRVFVTAFELSPSSITTPSRSSGSSSAAVIPPVVDELLQREDDEEADEWVVFRHRYYVVATDTFAVIVPCVLLLIPWPSASASSSSSSSSPKRCFLSDILLAAYSADIQRNIGPVVDAFAASMQQALRTPEKRREWFLLIVSQSWTFQGSVVTPTFLSRQQQQQQQHEQQCQGDANQYPPINPNKDKFLTQERTVRPFVWSCVSPAHRCVRKTARVMHSR